MRLLLSNVLRRFIASVSVVVPRKGVVADAVLWEAWEEDEAAACTGI